MKRLIVCLIFTFFGITNAVHAAYLDSIIYEMPADKDFISRRIFNDSSSNKIYKISAYEISSPVKKEELNASGSEKYILYSPLSIAINENESEFFKIFYRGPSDDKERYFRVIYTESPVALLPSGGNKKPKVIPMISISTILVVRPRKARLSYLLSESKGTITNNGNTFFRVIIQKGCHGSDDSSRQFYMLPGESYSGRDVNKENKKFIVTSAGYIRIGSGCSDVIH